MPILLIDHQPTVEDLLKLTEYFLGYIKLVADIDQKILYGGSEFHADMEKILLDTGSLQNNIWGGGVNLKTKIIDCRAVANIRGGINPSLEILDPVNRQKFLSIVKQYFPDCHE